MKYMNAGMILLFVAAAALQSTGQYPWIWIAVYAVSAVLCVMFSIGKLPAVVASVFAVGCLIASLVMFWQFYAEDVIIKSEIFNQAAGLFVVFLWLSTLSWTQSREQSSVT